jgi:hypothetical protein
MKASAPWSKLGGLYKGKERTTNHINCNLLFNIITVGELSFTLAVLQYIYVPLTVSSQHCALFGCVVGRFAFAETEESNC